MGPCLTTREGAQPLLRGDASTRSARIFLKKMCPAFARVIVFTYTGAGYRTVVALFMAGGCSSGARMRGCCTRALAR